MQLTKFLWWLPPLSLVCQICVSLYSHLRLPPFLNIPLYTENGPWPGNLKRGKHSSSTYPYTPQQANEQHRRNCSQDIVVSICVSFFVTLLFCSCAGPQHAAVLSGVCLFQHHTVSPPSPPLTLLLPLLFLTLFFHLPLSPQSFPALS